MAIFIDGIGEVSMTLHCDPDFPVGSPCYMDGDNYIEPCTVDAEFFGIVERVEGSLAAVTVRGIAEVPFSGTFPGYGSVSLAADGQGGVHTYADGKKYTVLSADQTKKTIKIFL